MEDYENFANYNLPFLAVEVSTCMHTRSVVCHCFSMLLPLSTNYCGIERAEWMWDTWNIYCLIHDPSSF